MALGAKRDLTATQWEALKYNFVQTHLRSPFYNGEKFVNKVFPSILHPPPSTVHPALSTLHPPPSTLHPPPSNPQTLKPSNFQPLEPSNPQTSTLQHPPFTFNLYVPPSSTLKPSTFHSSLPSPLLYDPPLSSLCRQEEPGCPWTSSGNTISSLASAPPQSSLCSSIPSSTPPV